MSTAEHPLDLAARLLGSRALMAGRLGVTAAAIGNWKARSIPPIKCAQIERMTTGAVTRRDLRPDDWHEIWPELVDIGNPISTPPTTEQPATAGA